MEFEKTEKFTVTISREEIKLLKRVTGALSYNDCKAMGISDTLNEEIYDALEGALKSA